ncbi:MAG: hypothetical protein Q9191_008284 [Dirinaria sp. TL-2023a]
MAQDYKQWLAAEVVSESKIVRHQKSNYNTVLINLQVTYRMLSRELKVHVNAAKRMLYDFHQTSNSRKPGSVHATYLLHGIAKAESAQPDKSQQDGQDTYMQSSPFMSSSAPQEESIQEGPPVKLVTLAREEHLEGIA